jgi:hypothetical protein
MAATASDAEPRPGDPTAATRRTTGTGADRLIARLAARQHGVVSRRQLLQAGVTDPMIDRRMRTGRLHAVFRGIFAVGHPALSQHGRLQAALLAAGAGAVLSHRTAAAVW